MSQKFFKVLVIVLLMGVLVTACEKPASTAPAVTPTGAGDLPFPVGQPTSGIVNFGTQTAIAKTPAAAGPTATLAPGGKTTPQAPQPTKAGSTPAPAQPTAVPPTEKPEVVVPTATPGRPASYTIQSGEHFLCIARRFNLNPEEFLSLNGLSMNSQAVVGQSVKIPQGGSWPSSYGSRSLKSHPADYTVLSGDTLSKVACSFGDADPNAIILANDLKAPYTLSAGDVIKVP
jgi:LysM repeat protein